MVNNEISRQPTFGKSRDKKNSRKCFEIFFSNLLVFFSYFITQFTKRTFVRHKNTQDILIFYMDQLFMLVTNPNIFLRLSQHFWFYFNFLIFFKIFYLYFLCLLPKCRNANYIKNQWITQLRSAMFLFLSFCQPAAARPNGHQNLIWPHLEDVAFTKL